MTSTLRRAGAFAGVSTLALAAPVLSDRAASLAPTTRTGSLLVAVPFLAVALGAFLVDDGPVFELFARPGDREEHRLYGLIGFSLAAAGLGLLAASSEFPLSTFVGTVVLVGYGNLAAQAVAALSSGTPVESGEGVDPIPEVERPPQGPLESPLARATAFAAGGSVAGVAGLLVARYVEGMAIDAAIPTAVVLAVSGALLGAMLRSVLFERDDPLVMLSVGLLLWLLTGILPDLSLATVAGAVVVTVLLGYVSYALETASVTGVLTGVLLTFLTIVLGGFGWLAVLITFFGLGGLSTKFKYDEKLERGVAEENEGARGSGNVLGNAAVAICAVVAYAAIDAGLLLHPSFAPSLALDPSLAVIFLYAFAGSLAAAMSDTLSSEVGGIYDNPRLITSLRVVEPGTDGAVTWQGELAGVAGAALVGGVAALGLPPVDAPGLAVVTVAGIAGMTVDSLLGATIEDVYVGNQGVNFLATLAGGVTGAALAFVFLL